MTKLGSREGAGWVPGIAPLPTPPRYPTPGTPLPPPLHLTSRLHGCTGTSAEHNMVVGLKSVGQLTLSPEISDIRGMTEVYNL